VAPWLQATQLLHEGTSRSKAYLYATSYRIYLYNASNVDVLNGVSGSTGTLTVDNTGTAQSTTSVASFPAVPVGSYTLTLNLYNSAYSSSTAIVSGSVSVTIAQGVTTAASVVCAPYSPTGISAIPTSSTWTSTAAKQEKWYKVTGFTGDVIKVTQANASCPTFIFNANGTYNSTVSSTGTNMTIAASAADPNTGSFYVGVASPTSGLASSLNFAYVSFVALNEGSVSSPVTLPLSTTHTFPFGPYGRDDANSYYKFTTTTAGSYYFSPTISSGSYNIYLYSNSDFSTLVSSSSNLTSAGYTLNGLSAGTIYYLKLLNCNTAKASFAGFLAPFSSLTLHNEGLTANGTISAVGLTLGTDHAATVGVTSYDGSSYYSFTTDSNGGATISVSGLSVSAETLGLYIGTVSTFASYSYSSTLSATSGATVFVNFFDLSPSTTYYLKITDSSKSAASACTFNLNVSGLTVTDLSLSADGTYTLGTISTTTPYVYYRVPVTSGSSYVISWDDHYSGSGTYSLDVKASAYAGSRASTYFSSVDSGYNTIDLQTITAANGYVMILVLPYSTGGTGTFGIRIAAK
jgi:hypothetical protein